MKYSVLVPLALLRAACHASKDENVWGAHNLDVVAINKGHIVATDGNIMFYSKLDNVDNDVSIVIPKAFAESFIMKTEYSSGLKNCQITYDTESSTGLIEIPYHHNAYEGFKVFLDKFINWQKAIPVPTEFNEFIHFNGNHITKLQEIGGMLGGICMPKIIPTGMKSPANVEFLLSDFNHAKAVLAPMTIEYDKCLYCVEIHGEDDSDAEQHPAASAEIAFRAAHRVRKDFLYNPLFRKDDSLFNDAASWIYPAVWNGSKNEHSEKMFYTEEWFSKPLKRYDDADKAIAYIEAVNDCVECYWGNKSITAYTVDDVKKFFTGEVK